ncbi:hypothetical protein RclHR1_01050009 [Rhizophagus clarus]|uniref:Ribonuclease H1 n=1 Tax=Rhizophagus clarus TaxID=94130 RepID=A0A2Z6Q2W8_9GLOM|nr:hypothetical protein RclHR1_01050009 [Rhizophagus clarus]GES73897.1 ribonuclease H1 [Rhizophagus clarus]
MDSNSYRYAVFTCQINNSMSHYAADNNINKMEAGIYLKLADNTTLTLATRLSYWPLSTKAELVAVFMALLSAPQKATIIIHTNSQCAILVINNWELSSMRSRLKYLNSLLLIKIKMICREKQLNISLDKVKGHNGIKGNEIADKFAKEEINCGNLYDNRLDFINNDIRFF